jgi:hypothetical protein
MSKKIILIILSISLILFVLISLQQSDAETEPQTVDPVLNSIFSDAKSLMNMKGIGSKPLILKKSVSELQREFCNSGKCSIVALYHSKYNQIWIREDFESTDDMYYKSILLHEIIHWIQYSNHLYEDEIKDCQLWLKREYQAYQLQGKWLFDNNSVTSVSVPIGLNRVCN